MAILTAAFIIANIWLISRSRDPDVKGMTEHAGLFIGLFLGLFLVACVVAAVLWKRYKKKASKPRYVSIYIYVTWSYSDEVTTAEF